MKARCRGGDADVRGVLGGDFYGPDAPCFDFGQGSRAESLRQNSMREGHSKGRCERH